MDDSLPLRSQDLRFFDPRDDFNAAWKRLPHWTQSGTLCFITWRTADSLPKSAVERLHQNRQALLAQNGIDVHDWRSAMLKLPASTRAKIHWLLFCDWDRELDRAAGACLLSRPELSEIVMNSLRYFDDDRYLLTDAVVMPNHVHLLAAFRDGDSMDAQCTSWKHFTAREINRWLRDGAHDHCSGLPVPLATGEFWQVEQFDHLVRGPAEFEKYRRYIAENPQNARLLAGQYRHFARDLGT